MLPLICTEAGDPPPSSLLHIPKFIITYTLPHFLDFSMILHMKIQHYFENSFLYCIHRSLLYLPTTAEGTTRQRQPSFLATAQNNFIQTSHITAREIRASLNNSFRMSMMDLEATIANVAAGHEAVSGSFMVAGTQDMAGGNGGGGGGGGGGVVMSLIARTAAAVKRNLEGVGEEGEGDLSEVISRAGSRSGSCSEPSGSGASPEELTSSGRLLAVAALLAPEPGRTSSSFLASGTGLAPGSFVPSRQGSFLVTSGLGLGSGPGLASGLGLASGPGLGLASVPGPAQGAGLASGPGFVPFQDPSSPHRSISPSFALATGFGGSARGFNMVEGGVSGSARGFGMLEGGMSGGGMSGSARGFNISEGGMSGGGMSGSGLNVSDRKMSGKVVSTIVGGGGGGSMGYLHNVGSMASVASATAASVSSVDKIALHLKMTNQMKSIARDVSKFMVNICQCSEGGNLSNSYSFIPSSYHHPPSPHRPSLHTPSPPTFHFS